MTGQPSSRPVLLAFDGLVITAAGVEAFDCPWCGDVRDLVVPDCGDDAFRGHDECADRACAECGFALTVGSSPDRASESLMTRRAG